MSVPPAVAGGAVRLRTDRGSLDISQRCGKIVLVMQTKVSTKGNVLLPGSIRRRLGIKAGDELNADVKDGNIVLTPKPKRKKPRKARIIEDPVTGLPVIDVGEDAPILTSEMVREMLADFP